MWTGQQYQDHRSTYCSTLTIRVSFRVTKVHKSSSRISHFSARSQPWSAVKQQCCQQRAKMHQPWPPNPSSNRTDGTGRLVLLPRQRGKDQAWRLIDKIRQKRKHWIILKSLPESQTAIEHAVRLAKPSGSVLHRAARGGTAPGGAPGGVGDSDTILPASLPSPRTGQQTASPPCDSQLPNTAPCLPVCAARSDGRKQGWAATLTAAIPPRPNMTSKEALWNMFVSHPTPRCFEGQERSSTKTVPAWRRILARRNTRCH